MRLSPMIKRIAILIALTGFFVFMSKNVILFYTWLMITLFVIIFAFIEVK